MTFIFKGGAEFQVVMIRCLSVMLHLPLLRVSFPSNAIMVISNLISFVMFDYLENPYDIDVNLVIEFKEYEQEEIDSKIQGQTQMIGYDTTNFTLAMQSIVLTLLLYVIQCIGVFIYSIWARKNNPKYLKELLARLFWDDLLTIFLETFIEFLVCGYHQYINPHYDSFIERFSFYLGISVSGLCIVFLTFALIKIQLTSTKTLKNQEFVASWGCLISEVKVEDKWQRAFNLVFSIKRAIFILIAFKL